MKAVLEIQPAQVLIQPRNPVQPWTGRILHFQEKKLVHRANSCRERTVNNVLREERPGLDFIGLFQLFTSCSPGVFGG